ncbi:glycosyltransferase family 4 protein [Prevotella salivae]|uniref:Glycosyltransferase family 4 protein n=1 Tax=Segatella salivae TaxID=228604 RepID=A0AAW4NT66_9BACT|nr:glycosyltransferase family 4 protein [Segatella salivae]MBW4866895.1 glycosyltransferase family 4 protein [Segatella salivae]MBW4910904.1 glycosyltransferase family 4 protein [Segatella salivae]
MKDIQRKKIIRVTTADISLNSLLKGQLMFLNQYFEVIGVAKDIGVLKEVSEREGIRVVDAPLERPISLVKDIKGLWFLCRLFRKEKPWCVHANTPKGSLLAMIAAWIARVPHRVYTVTGLRYQGAHGMLRTILKTMERLSCLFATNVIPEGQGVLHALQEDNITKKPLHVIWNGNINGIDTEYFKSTKSFTERKNDTFIFVFIGRIVRDKGIHELTECIRKLNCNLILVGSFEDGDPVDEDDKKFLLTSEKVKFVGWQIDVRPYLEQADVLVFPSYREGFPNVPMQAGAMGLPCIVTNINGCNEIIKDGLNGKIIAAPLKEGTKMMEQSLLNTMQWFIDHREEAKRMGNNARPMIQERYEQRYVWKALKEYYDAL